MANMSINAAGPAATVSFRSWHRISGSMTLLRDGVTVLCGRWSSSANTFNKQGHLGVDQVCAVDLYVVRTALCDDSLASRREIFEIFLHLGPYILPADFLLCGVWPGEQFRGVMRDDQDRERAVRTGMNCFLAGCLKAV